VTYKPFLNLTLTLSLPCIWHPNHIESIALLEPECPDLCTFASIVFDPPHSSLSEILLLTCQESAQISQMCETFFVYQLDVDIFSYVKLDCLASRLLLHRIVIFFL
jgi:hypothetical protein